MKKAVEMSPELTQALQHLEQCQQAVAAEGSLQAKEALMEAYVALAHSTELGSIDRMKHQFAAQDLATELLAETGESRFQQVIDSCQMATTDTMTQGILGRMPAFLRKKFK